MSFLFLCLLQLFCSLGQIYSVFDEEEKTNHTTNQDFESMNKEKADFLAFRDFEIWFLLTQLLSFFLVYMAWIKIDKSLKRYLDFVVRNVLKSEPKDQPKEQPKSIKQSNRHLNRRQHLILSTLIDRSRHYLFLFLLCDLLSLLNLIIQSIALDYYLHHQFFKAMLNFYKYLFHIDRNSHQFVNLFSNVYPQIGWCKWPYIDHHFKFRHQTLECIININTTKQMIYITVWFFFMILFFSHFLVFLHRILLMTSSKYRYLKTNWNLKEKNPSLALKNSESINHWFILNYLESNLPFNRFMSLVNRIENEDLLIKPTRLNKIELNV